MSEDSFVPCQVVAPWRECVRPTPVTDWGLSCRMAKNSRTSLASASNENYTLSEYFNEKYNGGCILRSRKLQQVVFIHRKRRKSPILVCWEKSVGIAHGKEENDMHQASMLVHTIQLASPHLLHIE